MDILDEKITSSNLLIYNSRIDLVDFIMENMVSKQEPDNLKIVVSDNSLNKYEKYNKNPYMLIPILKDERKTLAFITWLDMEVKSRDECFNKLKVDNLEQYNDVSNEKKPTLIVLLNDVMDFIRYCKRKSLPSNIGNFSDTSANINYDWEEFRDILSNTCIYGEKYGIQIILATKYDLKYANLEDLNSFFCQIDYEEFKKKIQEMKPLRHYDINNTKKINETNKETNKEKTNDYEIDKNGKTILYLQHND